MIKDAKRTEYYDVKTGLLVKVAMVVSSPQGEMETSTVYSDYKPFDGVLIATKNVITTGPQEMTATFEKVEINKNVSDADFK